MALGDDLKGELGLGGIHGEDRKIVDDKQVWADVSAHGAVEAAMQFGSMQIVEHARCADEHDTASGLTRAIGQCSGEEGLTGPRGADEERVDALVDEGDVMKRQIAGLGLLATRIEVEIEAALMRRLTAPRMRLSFSSSHSRCKTSAMVRFSFAACPRSAGMVLVLLCTLDE
jgi:hypothetical protein